MSNSDNITKIIKRIYSKRKTNNPLLVVYPSGEGSMVSVCRYTWYSVQTCKNGILTTTTEGSCSHNISH